jgi:peroxiredoxin
MAAEKKSGSKKQIVLLIILVIAAGLFVAGYAMKGRTVGKRIIKAGDIAPEFRVPASDGKVVSLSELRGSVVLVHFWATWCPPCVEEMPALDKLYRAFAGTDLKILAVSVDEGGVQSVIPFMEKNRLSVPVFYDPDRSIAGLYGTFKFPESYIVNRKGVVEYKVIGSRDWSDAGTMKIMQDLIAAR